MEFVTTRGESSVSVAMAWPRKVCVGSGAVFRELSPISAAEFLILMERENGENKAVVGFPTIYCQELPGSINVWPTPDAVYEVVVSD